MISAEVQADSTYEIVGRLAAHMNHETVLTTGDVASLRRMDPRHPPAAFFKLAGAALADDLARASNREDSETRWAAVVVGLAHLGDLYAPARRFGEALVAADLSELRFVRLLNADVERLIDELPSLARQLAARGVAVDWATAARLVLSAGRRDEEKVRRSVAREFYAAMARSDS